MADFYDSPESPEQRRDPEREIRKLNKMLQDIHKALANLPSPRDIYNKLISSCRHFSSVSNALHYFELDVSRLNVFQGTAKELRNQTERLILKADKLRGELLYIQTELRLFFAIPPVLFVLDRTTPDIWNDIIHQDEYDDNGEPIVLEQKVLETKLTGELSTLDELRERVRRRREDWQYEDTIAKEQFEQRCMAAIDTLQNSIDAIPRRSTSPERLQRDLIDDYTKKQNDILDALHNLETTIAPAMKFIKRGEPIPGIEKEMQTDTSFVNDAGTQSDVPLARSPARRPESESGIEAKRRRMDTCASQETPGGDSPTPQTPPPEESADDMEEFFRKNADFMEVLDEVNEIEGSVEGARSADSPEPRRAGAKSPERQSEKQHLLEQLRQAERARDDLASMIRELEKRPVCCARYFHGGEKLRDSERSLQCVFCLAVGRHYSASCTKMRYAKERKDYLKRTNRCIMCLKIRCRGGRDCKKYDTRCFYCDNHGHHSAVCELPEESERIRDRLSALRSAYADTVKKTVHLNLRLERKNAF